MGNLQLFRLLIILISTIALIVGVLTIVYSVLSHFFSKKEFKSYTINNSRLNLVYYGLIGIILLNSWSFIPKFIFLCILYLIRKRITTKLKLDKSEKNQAYLKFKKQLSALGTKKILIYSFIGIVIIISEFNPIIILFILCIFLIKKFLIPKLSINKFNKRKVIIPLVIGATILLFVSIGNSIKTANKKNSNQLYNNYNIEYNSKSDYNHQMKSSNDNRSNQLNPNNNSYYQSRGYNSKSDYNHQTKSSNDNRSNQMNPNNSSYNSNSSQPTRAASNNRSNQMNPNNSAYKGGSKK
jgi:hypothetical protein